MRSRVWLWWYILLYNLLVNSNGYIQFLLNTLDTLVRAGNLLAILAVGTFFTSVGEYCICLMCKDFHFIYDLRFGYFSFSNLFIRLQHIKSRKSYFYIRLFGFYVISTFVDYLMVNPFLYK